MFDWLHPHHDSPELEHAKHRQQERDAHKHADPMEEVEYIDENGLVVEEISAEEFKQQVKAAPKPLRRKPA